MPLRSIPPLKQQDPHADAASRLQMARTRVEAAARGVTAAAGTPLERFAAASLSSAHAEVRTREEWMHWVDEGVSLHPEADGEWGLDGAGEALPAKKP